jgi:hypothetical protein
MEERFPCDRHDEQIKTLFKKVEFMDGMREAIHSLDKNMAIQTELMKNMVDHNQKQDERMDKQDQKQDEQHEVIININANLTELTEGQRTLNKRVGKLEERVDKNDDLHKIDIRKPEKKKWEDIVYKIAVPGGVAFLLILEIIKHFI